MEIISDSNAFKSMTNNFFVCDNQEYQVRMSGTIDSPLFCAKDVCLILGIKKYRDALAKLKPSEGCPVQVDTLGGRQTMTFVRESGLYL